MFIDKTTSLCQIIITIITTYSLINIELDLEQIATKGFIALSSSTMYIKQHTKSLPTLEHHKKGVIMMFKK